MAADRLPKQKRGRKKSGTAESEGRSGEEMPSQSSLTDYIWGYTKADTTNWKQMTQITKVSLSLSKKYDFSVAIAMKQQSFMLRLFRKYSRYIHSVADVSVLAEFITSHLSCNTV